MDPEDLKKAATWAFLTAALWGWTWAPSDDEGMIWVNTGEREVGCKGTRDFVAFVSEENTRRRVRP